MEVGWVIAAGNPFDGIRLHVNDDGMPFNDHDEAVQAAELHFRGESWWIVPLYSTADENDAEDDLESDEGGEA